MKSLKYILITLVILLFGPGQLQSQENSAQRSKEQFRNFNHFPDNFQTKKTEISSIFSAGTGDSISIRLSDGFIIYGKVTEKVVEENGTQRMNFISSYYPQTVFNFSSIPSNGGTLYRARILNRNSNEALLLNLIEGKYLFRKTRIDKLIAE
ncbi:MAG: hypothetical protein ACXWV5_11765 [Flavitalea sp.]